MTASYSKTVAILLFASTIGACSTTRYPYRTEMMPPPAIYEASVIDPPAADHLELTDGTVNLPYATARLPAGDDDEEPFYLNDRGAVMRLGIASVRIAEPGHSREDIIAASFASGTEPLPLTVPEIAEVGVLPKTRPPFAFIDYSPEMASEGPRRYAEWVNERLSAGTGRDINIYVHGYKVVFENPLAVSTELWHYLDYQGVFIAFSWPATPKRLAYLGDLETGEVYAVGLRQLLQYLCRNTQARRINLIGYSAGARLVTNAVAGLSIEAGEKAGCGRERGPRIGDVVLIGSDMDRALLALYLEDGILDIVERFTVYTSSRDAALRVSKFLFGRPRAGETLAPEDADSHVISWLDANPKLAFVDVSDAADSTTENGHRYFRKSPWVSSDLLMMLRFELGPEQRGLVRARGQPSWRFPTNYIERLAAAVREAQR